MENTNLTPEQVVENISTMIAEKMQGVATNDDVVAIKNELSKLEAIETKSASIEAEIAKFQGEIDALKESSKKQNVKMAKNLSEAIVNEFGAKHAEILNSVEKGQNFNLDIKTDTTIAGDYSGQVALSQLEVGVNRIVRPIRRMVEISNVGATTSKYVTYIQQTTQSSTEFVKESFTKANGQVSYQEVSVEVKKVAGFIKVSKEMLSDLAFVRSEINNDLMESVAQNIDTQLLNGTGGTSLNGVLSTASAWSAGSFAGTISNPTIIDVLRVAKSQVEINNFLPSHIVLNPADVAKIELSKTSTGEYTYPNFAEGMAPNMQLSGLTIVASTNIATGTFLVGDFSKFNVRMREGMNIQVGYENDDFARNMVSILCEARLCSFVKANDVKAFVTGDVATAIAAL